MNSMPKWVSFSELHPHEQIKSEPVERMDCKMMRWIPIINHASNPMPQERKVYLVTYETITGKKYVRDLQTNYVSTSPPYIGWSKKVNGRVIAWMELPKPYGETDE